MKFANLLRGSDWFFLFPKMYYKEKARHAAIVISMIVGMLITGTSNTILSKFQTRECVLNCDGENKESFEQPMWQTLNMFVGEMLCGLIYILSDLYFKTRASAGQYERIEESIPRDGKEDEEEKAGADGEEPSKTEPPVEFEGDLVRPELQGKDVWYLFFPSFFDILGTTLMNVGLVFVSASIYQMLRGFVVILVAVLSRIVLKTKYRPYKLIGLASIFLGVCVVGLAPILYPNSSEVHGSKNTGLGLLFVLIAQFFAAAQFITEEKIILKYEINPLKMVGFEGLFGALTVLLLMFLTYITGLFKTNPMLDIVSGFHQIFSNPMLWGTSIGCAISIGGFNWFGLNITKYLSSTARCTIDTCRTLFIWLISLSLGWEIFIPLQVVGFVILIFGIFLFNDVFKSVLNKRE